MFNILKRAVARYIEEAHLDTSVLTYNNENALSYTIVREMPSRKGYADIAIKQIKEKKYPKVLENYLDNLLQVGISYDKDTKEHRCVIEKYKKP